MNSHCWGSINENDISQHASFHDKESYINSLVPGKSGINFELVMLKPISRVDIVTVSWHFSRVNTTIPHWWLINIDSGDDEKHTIIWTYAEPVLWRHMASLGHNKLTFEMLRYFAKPRPPFKWCALIIEDMSTITSIRRNFEEVRAMYMYIVIAVPLVHLLEQWWHC